MSHRLSQSFKVFTAKEIPAAPVTGSDAKSVLGMLSGLTDPNHSILLRALLDREAFVSGNQGLLPDSPTSTSTVPPVTGFSGLSASPSAYAMAHERLQLAREETTIKFLEFRDKWRKRLTFVQLFPFLQRNQWVAPATIGGYALVGKGSRKETKMLYLQTLHDMASDGERQVSFIAGQLFRLQGELAAVWHRESVKDDRSKLLPALEAALRVGESELFKKARLSLGDLALETFTDRVGRWDKRVAGSEEELFRDIAWPWYHARYRSGFEGFMEAFADLAEAVCGAMTDHYEGKWDLFLRGLTPAQTSLWEGNVHV